ncbi:hypothetical protein AAVH_30493 [Aphelenchoides avenae]|nr:hypothetical protein AAVH_30493 [Aphelenchus avenae]
MFGLCCSRRNEVQGSAFVKSSYLRWIVGDLRFKRSLPRHDYIQRLVEHFRETSSPECMRRVVFSPNKISREYASASYHLPGAYVDFFLSTIGYKDRPCRHCTYEDDEGRTSFVEVFHFPNVHEPDVCATVTFAMPADAMRLNMPTECSVEAEFAKGCPNAPIALDHSPRIVLHIATDVFIELLRFLPRSELEKMMLVSRDWSSVIEGSEGSLQQRHSFNVILNFQGESPGMLSLYFIRSLRSGQKRILRVLATRGLSHAHNAARSHLQNAFVKSVFAFFLNRLPLPRPPREMRVDIPLSRRIDWLKSLLRSMPPNSEIGAWGVADSLAGFDNLPTLASCALEAHRKLGCVRRLELGMYNRDATWTQLASLLNQPGFRGFREITISTDRAVMDASGLRAIISSLQSLKLTVFVNRGTEPQDALLTLPTQIIQDFLALRDVTNFVAEFALLLKKPDNIAFSEVPDVDEAIGQRKRFRCHLKDEDTVVRVSVYGNPTARGFLSVVTFDHFRRTVLIFKGNVSLSFLKSRFQRPCVCY